MSDHQTPNDTAQSRLDAALARIDAVIETVSGRIEQSQQDRRSLAAERDKAAGDLAELRRRYDELQAKAEHAATRIDALVAIVERTLLDGPAAAAQPAGEQQQPEGHHDGHHNGHDGSHHGGDFHHHDHHHGH
ncbi:hypothetical protein [Arenibaculum sp.]|jgi:chromosome segregation ATPase|uniref:hypothetical protein n=1 Tax=Arenibaculum sp. TaxID=2865862 RepID=UPI002E119D86|nr:hypothetical protein [Arenibaculum sp.]